MDFIYLFRLLIKKKWIILGATLVASLTAFVLTRNQPKKYRSIAQMSTGFTVNDEIRVNNNNDNYGYYDVDIKFNNVLVTFSSPAVMSMLSYTLILHDLQDSLPFRRLNAKQRQSPFYLSLDKAHAIRVYSDKLESMGLLNSYKPDERDLLELLAFYGYDYGSLSGTLNVNRLPRTDYIQLEFQSENPELSAFIVNTVVQEFLRYYRTVRSDRSTESLDTLKSILDRKKQELDLKNDQLRSEGIINVGMENSSKFEMIMNKQQTLTDLETKQTADKYALQRVTQQLETIGAEPSSGKTTTGTANDELVRLKQSRDEAYNAWINSGSSDESMHKKYQQLAEQYQTKLSNALNSGTVSSSSSGGQDKQALINRKNDLEVDLKAETTNIESINRQIADLNGNVVKDASKSADLSSLLKDVDLANKEYLEAKQRYNDANDIAASSVSNFRLVSAGQPATGPEPSKRILIVGLAGAFVLIASVLIISVIAFLDSSLKTPAIFAKTVGLRLISMVNFTNLKNKNLSDVILGKNNTVLDKTELNRESVFRESIRKLRYEIEHSGKKIFLFASTKKGEGKTTLIQMVAFSLSLSKKKILIIDTNFSNNDLTTQLNADPILEKIHPDKLSASTLISQVQHAAKNIVEGYVYAIGSKGGDYTPSEILPRENILQHLHTLTGEYDYIFLEGPPLNDFSDARELSHYVEAVIAIFSSRHVIKQTDKQSMSFFQELNGKFCGAVLNMVDIENLNVV